MEESSQPISPGLKDPEFLKPHPANLKPNQIMFPLLLNKENKQGQSRGGQSYFKICLVRSQVGKVTLKYAWSGQRWAKLL